MSSLVLVSLITLKSAFWFDAGLMSIDTLIRFSLLNSLLYTGHRGTTQLAKYPQR